MRRRRRSLEGKPGLRLAVRSALIRAIIPGGFWAAESRPNGGEKGAVGSHVPEKRGTGGH